jgi:hypothetical protein
MQSFPQICVIAAAMAVAMPGAIVDRVAITAGNRVITDSAITLRIRLTAFQNRVAPDFSDASRKEAAQRLIDQKLVEREMEAGHYARIPPGEAKELVNEFAAEYFNSDATALRTALAASALTPDELQTELVERADFMSFLSLRFQPAVEVSDADIDQYIRDHIRPGASGTPTASSQVRAGIEKIIASQRADRDLDAWLADQRLHTKIVYLVKGLE